MSDEGITASEFLQILAMTTPHPETEAASSLAAPSGSAVPAITEANKRWIDEAWEKYKAWKPEWTQTPPTHQGEYWHWNGDEDAAPMPMFVMWSGTSGKCFVSAGQLGITEAIDCDKYGGWWMMLITPQLPNADFCRTDQPKTKTP